MSRADELREYWEGRIPAHATVMYLADAARWINRDLPVPIISLRTLQRRAESGDLQCLGGSTTHIREYRVWRDSLIDFLVTLDVLTAPAPSRGRTKAKRRAGGKRRSKTAPGKPAPKPATTQRNLFDGDT